MAEFKLNPQQQKFLETNNTNLLVSASAGSGKTSTMIKKLIKILSEDRINISSLLVVTYTNAAASEIKVKLYNELSKIINDSKDIKLKEFLKIQLDNINNAEIGTLHAICKKLIIKYFYELGETPDFSLLSEKEQKYFIDMAVNNVFKTHIVNNDEEFFSLYDCYNSNRNDEKLKKMILQMYEFKTAKIDYDSWKKDFLNNSYNLNTNENIVCNYLLEHYQKKLLNLSTFLIKLKNEAESCNFDKYKTYLNTRYQFVNEFCMVGDFDKSVKVLGNLDLPYKPRLSTKASIDEQEFDEKIEIFGKLFNDLVNHLKDDYTSLDLDKIKTNIEISKKNVVKLLDLVDEVQETYKKIKISKNVLDFNDLEDKMLDLLSNQTIKDNLRSVYRYIFVDEYQDINDKQESILLNLVSENNYYMIGDVKQSIYAFRQSSPKIFVDKYNKFSNGENGKVINFNINYRSDKNILEFANSVFDNIITQSTIGIDYRSDARFDSQKEFTGSNVTFDILKQEDDIDNKDELEAKLIVNRISEIIKTKKTNGSYYNYSDIAIILRSRGDFLSTLISELTENQIPVKTKINGDFFGTKEISLLVSVLKLISNYRNDIAFSVVLKNLFNVSEYELMCIRSHNTDVELWQSAKLYDEDDNIKGKITNCFEFIKMSKNMLTTSTIKDFLSFVIDQFNLMIKLKTTIGGNERVNNIIEFLKISDNKNYEYNIDAFLDYLDIISQDDTSKIISSGNNAVEICTIHHSKGLEYPVVILGKLGKKYQLNKDTGNIIMNSKFGVGLKSINSNDRTLDETIIRNACKLDNKRSEINEEIRLLYVAMTRAKEKLYLLGSYNIPQLSSNLKKDIYNISNPFDMIFRSLNIVDTKKFENSNHFLINENTECLASVNIFSSEDFLDKLETKENPIVLSVDNKEITSTLKNIYSNRVNTKTTTIKNTVTNILREESDYENLNFKPHNLDVSDIVPNKKSLELGTAYHTVMQEIKFNENYIEIEEIISNLLREGKIQKEIVDYIKIDEILKCISVMKNLVSEAKVVYREKQFLLRENYNKLIKTTDNNTKVIIQGVIDLVLVREDGVYLIDYKTNRGVTEEKLADEYTLQLKLYSHAFEKATGISVTHKFLYSFKLGKLIEIK